MANLESKISREKMINDFGYHYGVNFCYLGLVYKDSDRGHIVSLVNEGKSPYEIYNLFKQKNEEPKEERFLSDDAVTLMSLLPLGITEKYVEKAFKVFGRTKNELASNDLANGVVELKKLMNQQKEYMHSIGVNTNTRMENKIFEILDNLISKIS